MFLIKKKIILLDISSNTNLEDIFISFQVSFVSSIFEKDNQFHWYVNKKKMFKESLQKRSDNRLRDRD